MATGGFKAADYIFNVNDTSSATVVANKVKEIVSNVCALIMQCEPHWQYDSNFTATSSDFIKIHSNTSDRYQVYAQFLVNSVTGSKLLVFYNWYYHVLDSSCCTKGSSSGLYSDLGLVMAMIPSGSSNTWNISSDCTTSNFIPMDGVLTISTTNTTSGTNTWVYAHAQNVRYVVVAKEDVIYVINDKMTENTIYSGFMIGKIFGSLYNSDDSAYYSHYGALSLNTNTSSLTEATLVNTIYFNSRGSCPMWNTPLCGNYFKKSITTRPITFVSGVTEPYICGVTPWCDNAATMNPFANNKTAFSPIIIGHNSSDYNNYDVSQGNGYKGYLDTDLIRIIYYGFPYNTLLNGGDFIYVGGGIALGWDSNNSIALRS